MREAPNLNGYSKESGYGSTVPPKRDTLTEILDVPIPMTSKPNIIFPLNTPISTKLIVISLFVMVVGYTLIILFGELFLMQMEKSQWCASYAREQQGLTAHETSSSAFLEIPVDQKEYENPDYVTDPCRYERIPYLCWFTVEECDLSRRLLAAVVLGGAIGYERRAADRPAGIRTMGLVSLGSAFFTVCSCLAFKSSTMGWDASRVSAAIPSGVGFIGAGLIWKGKVGVGDDEVHQVHGLTTAASVWLSASVGVGAGGALYFNAIYTTVLVLAILRFGPKIYLRDEDDDDESESPLKSAIARNVAPRDINMPEPAESAPLLNHAEETSHLFKKKSSKSLSS